MSDTCASCRFYNPEKAECRRRAPVTMDRSWEHPAHGLIAETATEWPRVTGADWCGEYDEVKRG